MKIKSIFAILFSSLAMFGCTGNYPNSSAADIQAQDLHLQAHHQAVQQHQQAVQQHQQMHEQAVQHHIQMHNTMMHPPGF